MILSKKIINLAYYYLKTKLIYKPFLHKAGKRFILIKPMFITPRYLSTGDNVTIRNNARIEGVGSYEGIIFNPEIVIDDNVKIQQNLHLTCALKIVIGKNSAIAANVTITDIDHEYENINLPPEKQPIKTKSVFIGDNCKIFNNAVILPGTHMGKHVIVGANSVVRGIFPDYSVIAGAPAIIIKRYNSQTRGWQKTDSAGNFIQ